MIVYCGFFHAVESRESALGVGQFVVAAVSDRRNLLNQKPAVRDRRYNIKLTHSRSAVRLDHGPKICYVHVLPRAINSAVECYPHTVEVTGSSPVSPTITARWNQTILPKFVVLLAVFIGFRGDGSAGWGAITSGFSKRVDGVFGRNPPGSGLSANTVHLS